MCNWKCKRSKCVKMYDWTFVYSLLLILFVSACNETEKQGVETRVMSFNIAAGHGAIDGIVRVIEKYNPDIVALQEIDVHWSERSNFVNQARYLGETLNRHYFFGEIYTVEVENNDESPRQYGLAFLSKNPLVHKDNHLLTRLSNLTAEPELTVLPGFVEIAVEIKGQHIHVFNTHLDYRRDPSVRLTQTDEMIKIMKNVDGPFILTGDLNARPEADEISSLFDKLKDSWIIEDDPGYTFPADQPDRRIDYILHSDHFEVMDVFVVDTDASDHRPVVADVLLIKTSNN